MERPFPPRASAKTQYLIAYNLASGLLWLTILGRLVLLVPLVGARHTYGGVGQFARWTQTAAVAEVAHSLFGVVRAPVLTTALQIASRLLLVWGIVHTFPQVAASWAYTSMLAAWALSEVVRYSYFVFNLRGAVPPALTWLRYVSISSGGRPKPLICARYNAFFVLYPLGIASEMWLVYLAASGPAGEIRKELAWGLYAVLGLYVPGTYVLFSHMMAQRRKIIRGKQRLR
ncbi:MAG: hypothetical protein M1832_003421 [Thelocarpon impressellum]|nr:MAG: hypothetical protein M1832_003421 [Thelocarpon impressellum]